jgi:hypothetical protein
MGLQLTVGHCSKQAVKTVLDGAAGVRWGIASFLLAVGSMGILINPQAGISGSTIMHAARHPHVVACRR